MTVAAAGTINWDRVRADFPLLRREVHGKPLVYLDSANTGQKPACVIEAVDDFYRRHNANVSRAVHQLGSEATDAYEGARGKLARFLNVRGDELVLCSGTTFALNLVAYSWALPRLQRPPLPAEAPPPRQRRRQQQQQGGRRARAAARTARSHTAAPSRDLRAARPQARAGRPASRRRPPRRPSPFNGALLLVLLPLLLVVDTIYC